MTILTLILAAAVILLDAHWTYEGIMEGHMELNRGRAMWIRLLGLKGGTYGVAVVLVIIAALVNVFSSQPAWSLILGNVILLVMFGWAAWRNRTRLI